jgi:THO complex subunit 1
LLTFFGFLCAKKNKNKLIFFFFLMNWQKEIASYRDELRVDGDNDDDETALTVRVKGKLQLSMRKWLLDELSPQRLSWSQKTVKIESIFNDAMSLLADDADLARYCDFSLPVLLLADALECASLDEISPILAILERNSTRIAARCFPRARLTMLQMCNGLLRRLSDRYERAELRGRVHLLISSVLPVNDRTGMNQRGTQSIARIPEKPLAPVLSLVASSKKDDDEANRAAAGPRQESTLWKFQRYAFDRKRALLEWGQVSAVCAKLLAQLSSSDVSVHVGRRSSSSLTVDDDDDDDDDDDEQRAFVQRFLAGDRDLARLQLADVANQRTLLVEMLVLLHSIDTPIASLTHMSTAPSQRVRREVDNLRKRVIAQLSSTGSTGRAFVARIMSMLANETHWSAWKANGCKRTVRSPQQVSASLPSSRSRKRLAPSSSSSTESGATTPAKRRRMPNAELTRLWNIPKLAIDDAERSYEPKLDEFLQPLIEQLDPMSGVEEQYFLSNDKVYAWRATRLVARDNFAKLAHDNLATMIRQGGYLDLDGLGAKNDDDDEQDEKEEEEKQGDGEDDDDAIEEEEE